MRRGEAPPAPCQARPACTASSARPMLQQRRRRPVASLTLKALEDLILHVVTLCAVARHARREVKGKGWDEEDERGGSTETHAFQHATSEPATFSKHFAERPVLCSPAVTATLDAFRMVPMAEGGCLRVSCATAAAAAVAASDSTVEQQAGRTCWWLAGVVTPHHAQRVSETP